MRVALRTQPIRRRMREVQADPEALSRVLDIPLRTFTGDEQPCEVTLKQARCLAVELGLGITRVAALPAWLERRTLPSWDHGGTYAHLPLRRVGQPLRTSSLVGLCFPGDGYVQSLTSAAVLRRGATSPRLAVGRFLDVSVDASTPIDRLVVSQQLGPRGIVFMDFAEIVVLRDSLEVSELLIGGAARYPRKGRALEFWVPAPTSGHILFRSGVDFAARPIPFNPSSWDDRDTSVVTIASRALPSTSGSVLAAYFRRS